MNKIELLYIDLFCGAGGTSSGVAVEWKSDSTMPTYEEWRNQMLGGLRPSDWDKFIVR